MQNFEKGRFINNMDADFHAQHPLPSSMSSIVKPRTIMTDAKCHIVGLPAELLLLILEKLSAESSTCLGLTCKAMYPVHKQVWGIVGLCKPWGFWKTIESPQEIDDVLFILLKDWFGAGWVFDENSIRPTYVTKEMFREREKARVERGREREQYMIVAFANSMLFSRSFDIVETFTKLSASKTGWEQIGMAVGDKKYGKYMREYWKGLAGKWA